VGAGVSTSVLVAVAVLRSWTRIYTWGLRHDVADERRAEVESDLWEMQRDPAFDSGRAVAIAVVIRTLAGAADDLAWRIEHVDLRHQLLLRRAVALAAAAVVVLALWTIPALMTRGRTQVIECASGAPAPQTNAELRLQVVRCAGAFFALEP
jgi:hypothetical protein